MVEVTDADRERAKEIERRWKLLGGHPYPCGCDHCERLTMADATLLATVRAEATEKVTDLLGVAQKNERLEAQVAALREAAQRRADAPHTPQCERYRVCGDPMGMVAVSEKGTEATGMRWVCFCGKDTLAQVLTDTAPAAEAFVARIWAECERAALDAKLPAHYQWGHDAMEQFNFGKKCAATAICSLRSQLGVERDTALAQLAALRSEVEFQVSQVRELNSVDPQTGQSWGPEMRATIVVQATVSAEKMLTDTATAAAAIESKLAGWESFKTMCAERGFVPPVPGGIVRWAQDRIDAANAATTAHDAWVRAEERERCAKEVDAWAEHWNYRGSATAENVRVAMFNLAAAIRALAS